MNNEAFKQSLATRISGAQKLIATLSPDARDARARAQATLTALQAIDKKSFTDDAELLAAATAAAGRRDAQKRFSSAWLAADAEHDAYVALHADLNPTPEDLYGDGSKPAPKEEPATA